MPIILNLDTSTQICSVALSSDGIILGHRESQDEKSHSSQLSIFIRDLLSETNHEAHELDAVAVSMGPGSYTGLRIGVSTAKGIAYGSNIPLIGIGTLDILVSGALQNNEVGKILEQHRSALLCPMLDARRMEVYTCMFSSDGRKMEEVKALVIDENSFQKELSKTPIIFFGDGAKKSMEKIKHSNAIFIDGISPLAGFMVPLAEKSWQDNKFENLAYSEPYYLKDFIATIPKDKIFPGKRPGS
jgi:tRNA threonylcarbamoyladenosine biosynthesis protein TsaB